MKMDFKPVLMEDAIGAYMLKKRKNKRLVIWRNFGKAPKFRGR